MSFERYLPSLSILHKRCGPRSCFSKLLRVELLQSGVCFRTQNRFIFVRLYVVVVVFFVCLLFFVVVVAVVFALMENGKVHCAATISLTLQLL